MAISSAPVASFPIAGNPPGGGASSFAINPSAGHTPGNITITVTYTGASAPGGTTVPLSVQSGGGSVVSNSWTNTGASTGTFTFTEGAVSGTSTVFLDSVTSTTQSFSNAAVAPLVPTIGTATNNHNGTATITFTPNADNGGATVTAANATGSLGDSGSSGGSSPITVTVATGNRGSTQTWTVTQTNSAGTSSASGATAGISVTSRPGVPTSPTASAGNASASVSFTPSYTGGLSVTYVATSTPGSITGSASSSPITVSGLTNGTAYTFTVHATNSDGTSAESSATGSVTPSAVLTLVRDAPYVSGDVLPGTPSYTIYTVVAGVLTAGSTITTGFNAVPNITGSYRIVAQPTANGSFGDYSGIAVFTAINTTQARAIALNSPATSTPTNLVYCEIAPFTTAAVIGSLVAQTLTLSAVTAGTGRTATAGGGTPFSVGSNPVGRYIFEQGTGTGRAIITARTSDTVVTVTIIDAFTSGVSPVIASSGWSLGAPRYADSTVSGTTITPGTMTTTGILAIPGVQNGFMRQRSDTPDAFNGCQIPTDWDGLG